MMDPGYRKEGTLLVTLSRQIVFYLQYCRRSCLDCGLDYDVDQELEDHANHETELLLGDTYFSLGYGHLEVRLQTCLIQVNL